MTVLVLAAAVLLVLTRSDSGPEPVLTLNLNLGLKDDASASDPVIARGGILAPEPEEAGKSGVFKFKSNKTWTQNMSFEVTDEKGKTQSWPWEEAAVNSRETVLELKGEDYAEAAWLISPEAMARIAPGRYTVRIVWGRGERAPVSPAVKILVRGSGEKTSAEENFLHAFYYAYRNEKEKALEILKKARTGGRSSALMLGLESRLLNEMGKPDEALELLQQAAAGQGELPPAVLQAEIQKTWKKASEKFQKENPDYQPPVYQGEIIDTPENAPQEDEPPQQGELP